MPVVPNALSTKSRAIVVATREKDVTKLRELLSSQTLIIDIADLIYKRTALMWASIKNLPEATIALLEAGSNPAIRNSEFGHTALRYAAFDGHFDMVQMLLEFGVDVSTKDHAGDSVLHIAAYNNDTRLVRLLLSAGADINSISKDGGTALHDACRYGYFPLVKQLVNAGVDISIRDHKNATALLIAIDKGHREIVNFLIVAD